MAAECILAILSQEAFDSQISAFLVALKTSRLDLKPDFIASIAKAVQSQATAIHIPDCFDLVGTGGDGLDTFNVSSAAAIVCAAAGLKMAKHGNRSSSSSCGSADFFEALGLNLNAESSLIETRLNQCGFAFLFSQKFYPCMQKVGRVRKEIGISTIFNILGPLLNPANPKATVVGVSKEILGRVLAESLLKSGLQRAWVVFGLVGIDEISPIGKTKVWSLENSTISEFFIQPADFGLPEHKIESIVGGDAQTNILSMKRLVEGELGPLHDVVVMNAAAVLHLSGKSLLQGVELAKDALKSGAAKRILEMF